MQITPWQRIFCLTLTLTSIFYGYFFVPGPLIGLKRVLGDVFGHTDSFGNFLNNICWGSKNRLFSKGLVQGFCQNWPNFLKSAFFARLCSSGSLRVEKIHWESFLMWNNALTKNFLFNPHPDVIFYGLFLCPRSLGWSKKCLSRRFRTHWFIWKLFEEYLYFV